MIAKIESDAARWHLAIHKVSGDQSVPVYFAAVAPIVAARWSTIMRILIATSVGILLLAGCSETAPDASSAPATSATSPAANVDVAAAQTTEQTGTESSVSTDSASTSATDENHEQGTWSGQIAFAQPVSMFNYVGAESGDFAPVRFRNDSEAGKKILAACADGQMCEFTGAVEWLDEAPPPDASAIGQIVKVDTVNSLATTTP